MHKEASLGSIELVNILCVLETHILSIYRGNNIGMDHVSCGYSSLRKGLLFPFKRKKKGKIMDFLCYQIKKQCCFFKKNKKKKQETKLKLKLRVGIGTRLHGSG